MQNDFQRAAAIAGHVKKTMFKASLMNHAVVIFSIGGAMMSQNPLMLGIAAAAMTGLSSWAARKEIQNLHADFNAFAQGNNTPALRQIGEAFPKDYSYSWQEFDFKKFPFRVGGAAAMVVLGLPELGLLFVGSDLLAQESRKGLNIALAAVKAEQQMGIGGPR